MKWQGEGVILSVRRHGENSVLASILTREHGRHAGMVRLSSRNRSFLQPGNAVQASWSARLPEHLGAFQIELVNSPIARFMNDSLRLAAMTSLLGMLDRLLAERHLYPSIYDMTRELIEKLTINAPEWLRDYAVFELKLLEILGYGLDLSRCVATGSLQDLVYVSPKSGCAVSRQAGLPYKDKLFELPGFISDETAADRVSIEDIMRSFRISGYFLAKYFLNGLLPDYRNRLLNMLRDY